MMGKFPSGSPNLRAVGGESVCVHGWPYENPGTGISVVVLSDGILGTESGQLVRQTNHRHIQRLSRRAQTSSSPKFQNSASPSGRNKVILS
ncbi:hypothetical protein I7I48_04158 [Histoplasma ohiense]|nr:hypothetical protein I7I48_04158 [Histoplasma ohiense (nom. inval.)]